MSLTAYTENYEAHRLPFGGTTGTYRRAFCLVQEHEGIERIRERITKAPIEMVSLGTYTIQRSDREITADAFVLNNLRELFERGSGLEFEALTRMVHTFGIHYLVDRFCTRVNEKPNSRDIVLYPSGGMCGVFGNGRVSSKWPIEETLSYSFEHEIFSVPTSVGNIATFWRVKEAPDPEAPPELPLESNTQYKVEEDSSLTMLSREGVCEQLDHLDFPGYCYSYAFGHFLGTKENAFLIHAQPSGFLARYTTATTHPQRGDLVAYYDDKETIVHWGVYLGGGLVESKWGKEAIYRHSFFSADAIYGDRIVCYTLKEGVTKEEAAAGVSS